MMVRTASYGAALNLRMATMQMAGIRVPPRVRTIPTLRRRLPVEVRTDTAQPVKIRHAVQKLDSPIPGTQLTQNQRV